MFKKQKILRFFRIYLYMFGIVLFFTACKTNFPRQIQNFNKNWKFYLGDDSLACKTNYNDSLWRPLNLPHDWSIEGEFSNTHATTIAGGALPAGIAWYRKEFVMPGESKEKKFLWTSVASIAIAKFG